MRKLKMKDIKAGFGVLDACTVETARKIKQATGKEKDAEKLGTSIIMIIISEYAKNPLLEKRVAEFLAGPFETTAENILDMDIEDLINGIKELGGIGYIMDFFKGVPA